jgi:hypothetical protein
VLLLRQQRPPPLQRFKKMKMRMMELLEKDRFSLFLKKKQQLVL